MILFVLLIRLVLHLPAMVRAEGDLVTDSHHYDSSHDILSRRDARKNTHSDRKRQSRELEMSCDMGKRHH